MYILENWQANHFYYRRSFVFVSDSIYECRKTHTSSDTFASDHNGINWRELPLEIADSSKFHRTIPDWSSSSTYDAGSLVVYDELLYESLIPNNRSSSFDSSVWKLLTDASTVLGGIPYYTNSRFAVKYWAKNDVIIMNNTIYRCTTYHMSSINWTSSESGKWQMLGAIPVAIYTWCANVYYNVGTFVIYNNILYCCIIEHQGGSTFDENYWVLVLESVRRYNSNALYDVGFTFKDGVSVYVCIKNHISSSNIITLEELTNFVQFGHVFGSSGGGSPSDSSSGIVYHYAGSVEIINNKLYYCILSYSSPVGIAYIDNYIFMSDLPLHVFPWRSDVYYSKFYCIISDDRSKLYYSANDHMSGDYFDESSWVLLLSNITEWQPSTDYNVSQAVIYDNKVWLAKSAHTSYSPFDASLWLLFAVIEDVDEATVMDKADIGDLNKPVHIVEWGKGIRYKVGDLVLYNGALYKVTTEHTATNFKNQVLYFKVICTDIPEWQPNTDYEVDDVVRYKNNIYVCTVAHTSNDQFDADELQKWDTYLTINTVVNDWQGNVKYIEGDLVLVFYDNKWTVFKCIETHTSASAFDTTEISKWVIVFIMPMSISDFVEGTYWLLVVWKAGITYKIGDIVIYDGKLYKCIVAHASSVDFNDDISNWTLLGDITDAPEWVYNHNYSLDDLVKFGGKIYKCIVAHTSGLVFDITKWVLVSNTHGIQAYQPNVDYVVGDLFIFDGKVYKVVAPFFSDQEPDNTKVEVLFEITIKLDIWQPDTDYEVDGIVRVWDDEGKGWKFYKCITAHTSLAEFDDDEKQYWELLELDNEPNILVEAGKSYSKDDVIYDNNASKLYVSKGNFNSTQIVDNLVGDVLNLFGLSIVEWLPYTHYIEGQLVIHNGVIYRVPQEILTTANYLNDFSRLNGLIFIGTLFVFFSPWDATVYYDDSTVVVFNNTLFICVIPHVSGYVFDNDEAVNWKKVANLPFNLVAWSPNTAYNVNDIVYVGDTYHPNDIICVYVCVVPHTSSNVFDTDYDDWELVIPNLIEWKLGYNYPKGVIVKYDGELLESSEQQEEAVSVKTFCMPWDLDEYDPTATYERNDMIIAGDNVFRSIADHTGSKAEKELLDSIDITLVFEWKPDTDYAVGDIVIYEHKLYRCITVHHSDLEDFNNDIAYWEDLGWELVRSVPVEDVNWKSVAGNLPIKRWKNFEIYDDGDIVVYGNCIYKCVTPHAIVESIRFASNNWESVIYFKPWIPYATYISGEVIEYRGQLYGVIVKKYVADGEFSEDGLKDLGISLDKKDRVIDVTRLVKWSKNLGLVSGTLVYKADGIYKVITPHVASDFIEDIDNFEPLYINIKEWDEDTDYKYGDIVVKNDYLYFCIKSHTHQSWDDSYWYGVKSDGSGGSGYINNIDNTVYLIIARKGNASILSVDSNYNIIDSKKFTSNDVLNGVSIPCIQKVLDSIDV